MEDQNQNSGGQNEQEPGGLQGDEKREDVRDGDSTLAGGDVRNKAAETRQADPAEGRRADIRLRAVSGIVIDYSLPLHESVMDQWRKGELSRVDDDDMPWSEGDEYDLSSAYEDRDGSVPDDMRSEQDDDTDEGDEGSEADLEGPGSDEDEDRDEESGAGLDDDEPVAALPDQDHANVADAPGPPAAHQPGRPGDNAPKKAWQEYALAVNAVSEDEAATMTRQQLIDRATPPELKPGA